MNKIGNYIHGKHVAALSSKELSVYDPSTGEEFTKVGLSSSEDFINVIKSSKSSLQNWSNFTPLKRSRILSKYKELIEKNIDVIASILSKEHGKTLDDARGSITRGLEVIEFACGIPHLLKGDFSYNVGSDIDSWSFRQPLGICAGITPFNFPAMMPMWMYPLSIAGVCTIASIVGTYFVRLGKSQNIMMALYKGFLVSAILSAILLYFITDHVIGLSEIFKLNENTPEEIVFSGMSLFIVVC